MLITELPIDIVYNILSNLDATALCCLNRTCRFFAQFANDELLWKHLVFHVYNLPVTSTFRSSGWKSLYSKLSDSRVYTWGENQDLRLGHPNPVVPIRVRGARFTPRHISEPKELKSMRGKGIVDIHAGGWSFHALDRHGRVWMWGTLAADTHPIFNVGAARIVDPIQVALPEDVKVKSMSCGRSHAIALAKDGSIWHWGNVWVPQRIRMNAQVLQVTANWGYSTVLTIDGRVTIVPLPPNVQSEDAVLDDLTVSEENMIDLQAIENDARVSHKEIKPIQPGDRIVQVAGMEKSTLALTRFGRLFKFSTHNQSQFVSSPASMTTELEEFGATEPEVNDPSDKMHRFITAQFRNFAMYTLDGKVLLGHESDEPPQVLPELQGDICKVSFGDYHCGALTNDGKLLTWGSYSAGALGHGSAQPWSNKENPEPVNYFSDRFVFAIGFGGWHSGALAIPTTESS
ncbi:RCC1/BLIP-II [Lichtheimia hyalospora FSU 10163]|nr:RCC1/BLIP-II [Lichtheimia hyalospora FSU 10163]